MFPQRYNSHEKLKDSGDPTYAAIVSKIDSLIAAYCPSKKTSVPSSLCGYALVKKIHFGDNTDIAVDPVPSRPTDPRPRACALRNLNGIQVHLREHAPAFSGEGNTAGLGTITDSSSVDSSLNGGAYEAIE
jgi:hypothetical protein